MKWDLISSNYVLQNDWLCVRKDHVRLPNTLELDDFYVVEYKDWANVIAITSEGKVVLEKQYRHGIQKVCIEIPAGSVEHSETPLEAAKRELLEETGYAGGEWFPYGTYSPNASGMSNLSYTFIARGVDRVCNPSPEASENIHVFLATIEDIKQLLLNEALIEADLAAPLWRFLYEFKK